LNAVEAIGADGEEPLFFDVPKEHGLFVEAEFADQNIVEILEPALAIRCSFDFITASLRAATSRANA
jgi:hypothetical protein